MAKKIVGFIKLQIPAGKANPSPPVGPALGQRGLNIMEFCKAFNAQTQSMEPGLMLPVVITAFADKSFTFIIKTPPTTVLIKKAAGIESGSPRPHTDKVGKLTRKQADSLTVLNRLYVLKSDSVWLPVARLLAELPDRYDHDLAYDRYQDAREQSIDVLIRIVPGIKGVLTPDQWRMLPQQLQSFMDKRQLQQIRSGTSGGGR